MLTSLAATQKDKNPVEAGMAHLHIAAIILEICRCSPTQNSTHLPSGAAELSRFLKIEELATEAFAGDAWIVKNGAISVQAPKPSFSRFETDQQIELYQMERDGRLSPAGFESALIAAAKSFQAGKLGELATLCYQLVLRLVSFS